VTIAWLHDLITWLGGALVALAATVGIGGDRGPLQVQGYVEGEYVYVGSPVAGRLETLHVARGARVSAGAPLFRLDASSEQPARDDAAARLARAKANLANLKKGKRPSEIQSLEAQLAQAKAMLELSEVALERREQLVETRAVSREAVDEARATHDRNQARVAELEAELETARLGARADEIEAAEAEVTAARAQLEQAKWRLDELAQAAPQAGLVVDTLYREGEWVAAGAPVVSLLPPENVKVRFFVPEPRLGAIEVGDEVQVRCDACEPDLTASISYISPEAEYTPPVIYSREMRAKLVYLVEAEPRQPMALRPGQPVDVTLAPVPTS
jgi:HlyD family secretion protein